MITSYVSPEGSLLYLSLVGPLDRTSAKGLLSEFDERVRDRTRRCILDLGGAESCDDVGLAIVEGLRSRSLVRGMGFGVAAGSSPVADAVRDRAAGSWIDVLPELPLSA